MLETDYDYKLCNIDKKTLALNNLQAKVSSFFLFFCYISIYFVRRWC